jgi:hypothetical protein
MRARFTFSPASETFNLIPQARLRAKPQQKQQGGLLRTDREGQRGVLEGSIHTTTTSLNPDTSGTNAGMSGGENRVRGVGGAGNLSAATMAAQLTEAQQQVRVRKNRGI